MMSQFASWAAEGSKNSNSTFNHFLTHYFQIQIVRGHDEGLFRGNRHYDENKTLFFYLIHSRDDGATAETRLVCCYYYHYYYFTEHKLQIKVKPTAPILPSRNYLIKHHHTLLVFFYFLFFLLFNLFVPVVSVAYRDLIVRWL